VGIETVALAVLAAATGYQAYQSKAQATDAKQAASQQQKAQSALKAEEDRNRLQSIMRIQKRRGGQAFVGTSLTGVAPSGAATGGKTQLGL